MKHCPFPTWLSEEFSKTLNFIHNINWQKTNPPAFETGSWWGGVVLYNLKGPFGLSSGSSPLLSLCLPCKSVDVSDSEDQRCQAQGWLPVPTQAYYPWHWWSPEDQPAVSWGWRTASCSPGPRLAQHQGAPRLCTSHFRETWPGCVHLKQDISSQSSMFWARPHSTHTLPTWDRDRTFMADWVLSLPSLLNLLLLSGMQII